jgi:hypothetical protein
VQGERALEVELGIDRLRPGCRFGERQAFATLVLVSLPPAAALVAMLRRTAWLHPTPVAISGGLAVGGVAATAMSLLHDLDATVMVLVWTLGATVLIVALGGLFGRRIFGWTAPQRIDV